MELIETKIGETENIYDGKLLHVRKDKVVLPDGRETAREYIEVPNAVAILPYDPDTYDVYLVKQFRYVVGKPILEVPAGKVDEKDSTFWATAYRELEEETGFSPDGHLIPVGTLHGSVAYSTEVVYLFFATVREEDKGEQHLDPGENLEMVRMPFTEAYNKMINGEIIDAKTQILLYKFRNYISY